MKKCTKCKSDKGIAEFSKHPATRDGLNCHCKACVRSTSTVWNAANTDRKKAADAAWKAANPVRRKATNAAWQAANRARLKATSAAWEAANADRRKSDKAAWKADNHDRCKATNDAWRAANPSKIKAANAVWRAANPDAGRTYNNNRRARKLEVGGNLSSGLRSKLFTLQQGKCPCCRKLLGDDAHLDHIQPLKLGGQNIDSNIQLLRATCNLQKSASHPLEFMRSRGFLL